MRKFLSILICILMLTFLLSCEKEDMPTSKSMVAPAEQGSTPTSTEQSSTPEAGFEQGSTSEASDESTPAEEHFIEYSVNSVSKLEEKYYTYVLAGNYLGDDLAQYDKGGSFRKITTYEDFCSLVSNPSVLNKSFFNRNYVLVIKRVLGGYCSDIGFRDFDDSCSFNQSTIILDYYANKSEGTDDIKTIYDYILIPREHSLYEEEQYEQGYDEELEPIRGELTIISNAKSYYEHQSIKLENDTTNGAWYFYDINSAQSFLDSREINLSLTGGSKDGCILMFTMSVDSHIVNGYRNKYENCLLGFTDIYGPGSVYLSDGGIGNIYIILEELKINDQSECIDFPTYLFCVYIPSEQDKITEIDAPSSQRGVHILININQANALGLDLGEAEDLS